MIIIRFLARILISPFLFAVELKKFLKKHLKGKFWEEQIYYILILLTFGLVFGIIVLRYIKKKDFSNPTLKKITKLTLIIAVIGYFMIVDSDHLIIPEFYKVIVGIITTIHLLIGLMYLILNNKCTTPETTIPVFIKKACKFLLFIYIIPFLFAVNWMSAGENTYEEIAYVDYINPLTRFFDFGNPNYAPQYELQFENGGIIPVRYFHPDNIQPGDYVKVKIEKGLFNIPQFVSRDSVALSPQEVAAYKQLKNK